MRQRIVGYNILSGGEGRADPLAEVLIAQRADLIVIEQADDSDVLQRLASRLDMIAQPTEILPVKCAILSRIPIDEILSFSSQSIPNVFVAQWIIDSRAIRIALGAGEPPRDVVIWFGGDSKPVGWIEPKLRIQRRADDSSSHTLPARAVTKMFLPDNLKVIDAWIEHDRLAMYASDHLPVGVEIEL